jgi:hypothetical protein
MMGNRENLFVTAYSTKEEKCWMTHEVPQNILWHVDVLVGNDHEISYYTTAAAK